MIKNVFILLTSVLFINYAHANINQNDFDVILANNSNITTSNVTSENVKFIIDSKDFYDEDNSKLLNVDKNFEVVTPIKGETNSNPKEIIKNSISGENEINNISTIKNNMISNIYLFIINILFLLIAIILFIISRIKSKVRVKEYSEIYVVKEKGIGFQAPIDDALEQTFLSKIGDKFLLQTNNRIDLLSKKTNVLSSNLVSLHEKMDQLMFNLAKMREEGQNRLTDYCENTDYLLQQSILQIDGLSICDVNKTIFAEKILFSYYKNSTNIEREFELFNKIPYEVIKDRISCYNDIFVVGQTSKIFANYIGTNKYLRNFASHSPCIDSNDNRYSPTSLIASNVDKCQTVVVTNPYLSMVLVRSSSILEELKDKVSEAIVFPVILKVPAIEVVWDNFSSVEKSTGFFRWAIGFDKDSGFIIHNNTLESFSANISFSVKSLQENAEIEIITKSNTFKYKVNNQETYISFTEKLEKGVNNVVIKYSGSKNFIGADPREIKFSVINMNIQAHGQGRVLPNEIYDITATAKTEDDIIRKRLHQIGFFEIKAEVITQKGLYCRKLPSSHYTLLENYKIDSDFLSEIRDISVKLNEREIPVLYIAYRKRELNNE